MKLGKSYEIETFSLKMTNNANMNMNANINAIPKLISISLEL